ncbi:MAG: NAD(P)/FAD-dependent oxidoreductase [Methylotenera sp.]|nr:NAD(P)/FAD-dependent oxidoreductase [Oligoflexia bacterium]
MQTLPHVVIIGAGFGGLRVARGLRKFPISVTVIDRRNHHLFQPLLYQVATAALSPADIATPVRSVLSDQSDADVMLDEVIGVNPQKKEVLLTGRSVNYDYLVIATGSTHSYFGHDDWEKFAPGLKTIADATNIRQKILLAFEKAEIEPDPVLRKNYLTFIIVGGGPTGVEMAGSIAELAKVALASDFRHIDPKSARIILIEANTRVLATFPESLSANAKKVLQNLGVEVMNGARVEKVDAEGVLVSGKRIFSSTVMWAAGVQASPAGKWLNAETDRSGRVKVQPDLSVANHPEIFVIGDTAHVLSKKGIPLPGVAPVAMQQGSYVAKLIRSRIAGRPFTEKFTYFNKGNLATIGRASAVCDLGKIKLTGFIAWLAWIFVHIFYLIGFRNRVLVLLQWAWSYVTYQRGARLITSELRTEIPSTSQKAAP